MRKVYLVLAICALLTFSLMGTKPAQAQTAVCNQFHEACMAQSGAWIYSCYLGNDRDCYSRAMKIYLGCMSAHHCEPFWS